MTAAEGDDAVDARLPSLRAGLEVGAVEGGDAAAGEGGEGERGRGDSKGGDKTGSEDVGEVWEIVAGLRQ